MALKTNILAGIIAGAGSAPFIGFAATGGRLPVNTFTPIQSGGTRYIYAGRGLIEITADCDELEFHFDNVYYSSSGKNTVTWNRILEAYALEKLDQSLAVPIKFGGNNSYTIPPMGYVKSDKLMASSFGLPKYTKGERYWLRNKERAPVGGLFLQCGLSANVPASVVASGTIRQYYDEATESGVNIYGTGPIPQQTGRFVPGAGTPGPTAITAKLKNPKEASTIVLDDSIGWGTGNSFSTIQNIAGVGHFDRAMVGPDGKVISSFCNLAVPGSSTADVLNDNVLINYFKYANIAYPGHGVNDIGASTPGANMAAIAANKLSLYALLRAEGVKKIIQRGIFPVTTSAGGQWINPGDQTVNIDYDVGSYGDQLEALYETWKTAGIIDATVYPRTPIADSGNRYKWATDGVTNRLNTPDGVHITDAGSQTSANGGMVAATVLEQAAAL